MPFNFYFVGRSLAFLKTLPNVFSDIKAVLMFSRFRICRIRSDASFTYGIDAYTFGRVWLMKFRRNILLTIKRKNIQLLCFAVFALVRRQ